MSPKTLLFYSAIVAALGGFLFGFDTAVISGAEGSIQELFKLNDWWHGFTVSIALYGTVIGALVGGIPGDRYGRKYTLIGVAILYFISALGSAFAPDWYSFMFFRFIGGLGVGVSSVVGPMYITEIAPAKKRGRLVALFQFNIVLGILIAYLSNYLLGGSGENSWRWMLGVESLPAILFFVSLFFIPESPRWLVKKGLIDDAKSVLTRMGEDEVDQEVEDIEESLKPSDPTNKDDEKLFNGKFKTPIKLAVLLAIFNQLSGINAIIYYAPRIFEMAGLEQSVSLISTVGLGTINLTFTVLAMFLIDRYGRKALMYIGSVGVIIFLTLVSRAFFQEDFGGNQVPIYILGFIAFFAISQGAVIWVYISEIFPNKVRAKGQSLGSFTHWIMAAVIASVFPGIAAKIGGGYVFIFFAQMMILQFIFVWKVMIETKGKSLEEIQKNLEIQ